MFIHSNFQLSKNGIKNFHWPVNQKKMKNFIHSMILDSVNFLQSCDGNCCKKLKITNTYFPFVIAHNYQAKIVAESLSTINSNEKKDYIDLEYLEKKYDNYLSIARKGLKSKHGKQRFESLKHFLITLIRNDGLIRGNINLIDFNNAIVSTGKNPLLIRYLSKKKQKAYLISLAQFFPSASEANLNKYIQEHISEYVLDQTFFQYLDMYKSILNKVDLNLDLSEVVNWHKEFFICIDYYQEILKNSTKIPKVLYIGTEGILWNKLLAIETRKRGGEVIVFDHANGTNLSIDSATVFYDFQELDSFVTFSEVFKSYFETLIDSMVYSREKPNIISILDV